MRLGGAHIGIVGGGVGGLAAAVALQRLGAEIHVFERARRAQGGVALLVWSNAMRALQQLGLAHELLAVSAPIERTIIRRSDGEPLAELPIGEWSERAGTPTVALRRNDLITALAARVPAGTVQEGAELESFDFEGQRVRVRFRDGMEHVVDALIGADGLGSTVRAQLHGDQPPRMLAQQAWVGWVATAPDVIEPGLAIATIGRGPRFWCTPLARGVFWYATTPLGGEPRKQRLLEQLAGWHAPIGELVDATSEEHLVTTRIRDRPPLERWGTRTVTLLGDAAHPSTPDLGQGACQAIESAVVLARCLEHAASIEEGLRAYEAARIGRTATIARLSWMTSVNSTIEAPTLCRLRDTAIRFGLRAVARGHLEWILAGQPC